MRWFLIPAVATTALALTNPTPAQAQIMIGGSPTYYPRYTVPFSPYTRVVTPVSTQVVPVTGGPVDVAMNQWLTSLGSVGYGPYAGYYGFANPTSYAPWGRPFHVPTTWNPVAPRTVNPGLPKVGFKGFGKGR